VASGGVLAINRRIASSGRSSSFFEADARPCPCPASFPPGRRHRVSRRSHLPPRSPARRRFDPLSSSAPPRLYASTPPR